MIEVLQSRRLPAAIEVPMLSSMRRRSFLLGCILAAALCSATAAPAADMTVKAVVERLVKSTREQPADFSGRDLSFLDLSDLDFKDARLAGADLYGTDLSHANLAGADLAGARLDRAAIIGTDLSGAHLSRARLRRA